MLKHVATVINVVPFSDMFSCHCSGLGFVKFSLRVCSGWVNDIC
jgi:hypothetical protein